jgi:hypothetical protein
MLEFSVQHAEVGTYVGSRDSIPRAPMRGVRGISVGAALSRTRSFAIACIRLAPRWFPSFRRHRESAWNPPTVFIAIESRELGDSR